MIDIITPRSIHKARLALNFRYDGIYLYANFFMNCQCYETKHCLGLVFICSERQHTLPPLARFLAPCGWIQAHLLDLVVIIADRTDVSRCDEDELLVFVADEPGGDELPEGLESVACIHEDVEFIEDPEGAFGALPQ